MSCYMREIQRERVRIFSLQLEDWVCGLPHTAFFLSFFFFKTLPSILAVINIKCQQHDKQVHHFSLACHYRYNLEGRDTAAVVSVWWQDKWGCLNVRRGRWAPGARRHASEQYDLAVNFHFNTYSLMVLLRTCSSKAPVLFVVPGSNRIFQEGNLLVTGVNTFCIFNPRKCLQMGSCHPGKWVCDLYPPLAESEWWKLQTPPGGPAARLGVGLWSKAFICPAGATSALSSKKPAESWCRNSLERLAENVVILIWIQRSKVLRLPFSVFSFLTWRALLTFLKAKKKKKCHESTECVSRLQTVSLDLCSL